METKDYVAAPKGLFHTKKALDYTIFEVQDDPGKKDAWANLPLQPPDFKPGERINIIQHPGGQPKQISMQNNMVEYIGSDVLQYVTSTLPGSSGSPIFNDRWQVVGLHHAGGLISEPTTGRFFNRNEGIVMSKILADLPTEVRQEIDKAAQELMRKHAMSPKTDLLDLLVNLPEVDTVDKRKAFVSFVGFASLGIYLDWEGANVVFFPRLLNELSSRGQPTMLEFLKNLPDVPQAAGVERKERAGKLAAKCGRSTRPCGSNSSVCCRGCAGPKARPRYAGAYRDLDCAGAIL